MEIISGFFDEYRFLSNFYPSPFVCNYVPYFYDEHEFKTNEHFYQAMKMKQEKDFIRIIETSNVYKVKKLGNILSIRDNWTQIKQNVMYYGLQQKFSQNEDLKQKLIDTYPKLLIEENCWNDKYWGIYRNEGKNILGKMLESIRFSFIFFQ